MAAGVEDAGEHRLVVVPDGWLLDDTASRYVASLPNAVGTFTGTFDMTDEQLEELFGPPPDLIQVELDTHDQPNPIAGVPRGTVLTFTMGGRRWRFEIDHASLVSGNRWTAWCYRDSIREVTISDA